ncbi:hypothetical protein [Lysinibacillus xylanilyticus]|uniref:hypothetical protein n=1 Tax=Lysinibacillus xylanilyticus TaxID=582475 RepID=UPI003D065690
MNQVDVEKQEQQVNLADFIPSNCKGINKATSTAGVLTIVNSQRNGKRVVLSKELMKELNEPNEVQISYGSDAIAIGADIPSNDNYLTLKTQKAKSVIYSSELVNEITVLYDLKFVGIVSQTFYQVQYQGEGTSRVAIISMVRNK